MRYLHRIDHGREQLSHIRSALLKFDLSKKFVDHLLKANGLDEAILTYKSDVLQKLSYALRKRKREDIEFRIQDNDLIDRYLHDFCSTPERTGLKVNEKEKESFKRKKIAENSPLRNKNTSSMHNERYRRKGTQVCSNFESGKCRRGKSCHYSHIF